VLSVWEAIWGDVGGACTVPTLEADVAGSLLLGATFSLSGKMTEGISRLEAASSHSLPTHDSDETDLCSSAKPKDGLLPDPTVWMHDPNIFVNNIVKSQE
ncbi:unnamed protein product, partial [Rangifer tarandus platyrhynchus]